MDEGSQKDYLAGLQALEISDYVEARNCFLRAAQKCGHPGAQCELGRMYEEGRGVPLMEEEAVSWYRKAADQGFAKAQCNLAIMYEEGRGGLPFSEAMAAPLFQVAAEHGNKDAAYNLGIYYERGRGGLERSRREAKRWFSVAASAPGAGGADQKGGGSGVSGDGADDGRRGDSGHPDGQYALALILLHEHQSESSAGGEHGPEESGGGVSTGVEQAKRAQAIQLLQAAADQHHALSQRELAKLTGNRHLAHAAANDHTLVPLDSGGSGCGCSVQRTAELWEAQLGHGDVVVCKFEFLFGAMGDFFHWAIFDKERRCFIEFMGRTRHRHTAANTGGHSADQQGSGTSTGHSTISSSSEHALVLLSTATSAVGAMSSRFAWGSGAVPLSNATVEATPLAAFVANWEQGGVSRVKWSDPLVAARGPSAVTVARARIGEVAAYNPAPRFGQAEGGLNCESFVRQCLDGHARSAQIEALSGDPDGGLCPVM